MDSITQAALGASVGFLCWHKELGRRAVVAGAVLGSLPDMDIVIYPLLDSVERLYWHRGESHSLFFVLFGALLSGWFIRKIFQNTSLTMARAFVGTFFVYATHILIDLYTIYGTQLLAPFSRHGFAMGNMFIIDPVFTLTIVVGVFSCFFTSFRKASKVNAAALAVAALYSLWSCGIQYYADRQFHEAANRQGYDIKRHFTGASAFNTFLWRHVAETPDGFLIGYWSVFDARDQDISFYTIPRNIVAVEDIRGTRTFQAVEWFSKGWWFAIEDNSTSLKIVDIRFNEIPSEGNQSHIQWNWPFVWSFSRSPQENNELVAIRPAGVKPSATLRLLVSRITGRNGWLNDGNRHFDRISFITASP